MKVVAFVALLIWWVWVLDRIGKVASMVDRMVVRIGHEGWLDRVFCEGDGHCGYGCEHGGLDGWRCFDVGFC